MQVRVKASEVKLGERIVYACHCGCGGKTRAKVTNVDPYPDGTVDIWVGSGRLGGTGDVGPGDYHHTYGNDETVTVERQDREQADTPSALIAEIQNCTDPATCNHH